MKKKLVIGLLLMMVICFGWFYFQPVSFYKESAYVVFSQGDHIPATGTIYHANISYQGMKKVSFDISDYKARREIDPAYHWEERSSSGRWLYPDQDQLFMVNLTQNNMIEFSEISYSELGKTKTAAIGRHHLEMVNTPVVQEAYIADYDVDHSFYVYLRSIPENLKRIELANPDIPATISKVEKAANGLYRYKITYEMDHSYQKMHSSVKYIMETNGEESVRYGGGILHITSSEVTADHDVERVNILYTR